MLHLLATFEPQTPTFNSDFYLAVDTVTPVVLLTFSLITVMAEALRKATLGYFTNKRLIAVVLERRKRRLANIPLTRRDDLKLQMVLLTTGWKAILLTYGLGLYPIVGGLAVVFSSMALVERNTTSGALRLTAGFFFGFIGFTIVVGTLGMLVGGRAFYGKTASEAREALSKMPELQDPRRRDPGFL